MDYYIVTLLAVAALLFTLWAEIAVNGAFRRYSKVRPASGMTGMDAARRILDANGLYHVQIEHIPGNLTDHFDPRTNVIRLSDQVYGVSSAAAIGVAAHEAGHAVQHAQNYVPLKIRNAIIPITNIGSRLAIPLLLIGVLLSVFSPVFIVLAYIGVAGFGLVMLFQLVTLPTEFNASRRALAAISDSGMLTRDELGASRKVLRAAAMTYVAALAYTITQFLRLLLIVSRSRRD